MIKYTIKWLFPYWKRHKFRMIFIVLLGILSAFFQSMAPFYIKKIINGFEKNLTVEYLKTNVLIMLSIGIGHFIVNLLAQRNRAYMNYITEYEIRNRLFTHILSLDEILFFKYNVGEVLTRLVDDISEKIAWFSCSGVFRFVQAVFTLIAIVYMMAYLNFKLTLIALIPFPFMIILVIKMGRRLTKKYEELQNSISNTYDYLETSFSGIKIIKANMKERKFEEKFLKIILDVMDKSVNTEKNQLIVHFMFFSTAFLSVFFVYLFGGVMVINNLLSVGDLVSFQIYTFMLIWPSSDVSQFFITLNRAYVSIKRVDELLNLKPSIKEPSKKIELKKIGDIEIKKLSVSVGEKRLLKNINLYIKSGQKIAIVGKVGSSKSTLLKVIARIIPYDSGEFLISSIDINKISLKDYHNKISYISQEALIITDTIKNNITMYKSYSDKDIEKVLKIVQLEEDISNMPHKLNTLVGDKGVSLSGGQKQRISIARALIRMPELIIMDDATTQMDLKTEYNFWRSFNEYFSNTTLIFTTHRTFTLQNSDKILVMEKGEIKECGTHNELISKDTIYKKIYYQYKNVEEK